jgi:hypothetical protein
MKKRYEIFKMIQNKLENDEEFAKEFYDEMTEKMFNYSRWAKIEDIKFGDPYPYDYFKNIKGGYENENN